MSEIDKNKSKKGTLLVWVTNPEAAGRIVSSAKLFASDKSLDLKVVSVQRETRDNWTDTIRDLERLQSAASGSDAELTVVYSDDRIEAAKKLVRSEKPMAMFAGVPDKAAELLREALGIFRSGHFDGGDEVLPPVRARCADRELAAREDHRLGQVLQHETQRRGRVGHRVRPMQHDESVILVVVVGNDVRQVCP